MKPQEMLATKLVPVQVEIYEILLLRIEKIMKDWNMEWTEALNLFLDWGSIHAVKFMEKKLKEKMEQNTNIKEGKTYVN